MGLGFLDGNSKIKEKMNNNRYWEKKINQVKNSGIKGSSVVFLRALKLKSKLPKIDSRLLVLNDRGSFIL